MSDTLGSLRAEILLELRGDLATANDIPLVNAKLNNALESIWMAMMQVQLARFLGADSPVTFTLPAGAERVQLVSILDPTVALAVSSQAGGILPQRTLNFYYTYVSESGSETNLSPVTQFVIPINNLAVIAPPPNPGNAFGWNLYAGVASPGLQNQQPLAFGQNFNEPAQGFQDYPQAQQMPPAIQLPSQATPLGSPPPNENSTADNISWIKHLEIRTSQNVLRTWNQYDLDSEISRRYGSTYASSSEYQTYAWDLINGNRLEFRPGAGSTFTPRYFYIAKPRRLLYDQAEMPYVNISGVHEFLTNQAIGALKLSIDEYLAAQAFQTAAQGNKLEICKALRQEDWGKNVRIQPHLY